MAHILWGVSETEGSTVYALRQNRVVFGVTQGEVDSTLGDLEKEYPAVVTSVEDIDALCRRVENAFVEVTGGLIEEVVTDYLEEHEHEIKRDNRRML